MSRTITCTNPACEAFIPIPEDASQVICSQCNTWHLITAEQFDEVQNDTPGFGAYDMPSISPDSGVGFDDNGIAPPVSVPEPIDDGMGYFDNPGSSEVPQNDGEVLAHLLTDSGVKLLLRAGQNIIGRKNTDLVINDRTISRKHCVIEIATNQSGEWEYFIFDIGHLEGSPSTNGVFVSGRTLRLQDYERVPMRNGTAIRLGNVNLVLKV